MKSILPKLDASDRTHAVTIVLKRGILDICPRSILLATAIFRR